MKNPSSEMTVVWIKKSIPITPDSQKLHDAVAKFEKVAEALELEDMTTVKALIDVTTKVQVEVAAFTKKKLDAKVLAAAVKLENAAKIVRNYVSSAEKQAKSLADLIKFQKIEIVALDKTIAIGDRKIQELAAVLTKGYKAMNDAKTPEAKEVIRTRLKQAFEKGAKDGLTHSGQEWDTFWRASVTNLGKMNDATKAKVEPLSDRMAILIKARDAVRNYAKTIGIA